MRDIGREELIETLLSLQPQLEKDGVKHVALFGSRARGDHRLDSDIDLLVDLAQNEDLSLLDIIGIGHLVEDLTGLPAQIVLRRSAPERFLAAVAVDQVPVF